MPSLRAEHLSLLVGLGSAFLFCLLIIRSKGLLGHLTLDSDAGIQRVHTRPTPRIGGLAVILGLISSWAISPPEITEMLAVLILGSLPAFAAGFAEDVSKRISPTARVIACLASGALLTQLSGVQISRLDLPLGLDYVWSLAFAGFLFTSFAVGGLANSINMVDGHHGLASGLVLLGLVAIGLIAFNQGDGSLAKLSIVLSGAILGFMLLNFPFGKIFLGDGGAYLLGTSLGWCAVLLVHRNPQVSPWVALLVCAFPVVEVAFTVFRRLRRNHHPAHPDRLHLHSLVKTRVTRKHLQSLPRDLQNAAVSPAIWLIASIPCGAALAFPTSTPACALAFALSFLIYLAIYGHLLRFASSSGGGEK